MALTLQTIQSTLKNLTDEMLTKPASYKDLDNYWEKLNQLQCLCQVEIGELDFKGLTDHFDESITLNNLGGLTIDLCNWTIQAGSPDQEFTFPKGSVLAPHGELKVATAGDSKFSFQSKKPIWNNHGDTATLLTPNGQVASRLVYGGDAYADVLISNLHFDGEEKYTEADEFVEISNISDNTVDISLWRLESIRSQTVFTFPEGSRMLAQSSVKVFTNKTNLGDNEFSFNSPRAIWNNESGCCKLFDYLDHEVASYQY
ncbi:lamin tail domain-containing protein [Vibrio penaeicida]|uniref:lamin tail domain-containing protein n=1 Tax=Vibrio penaeicida TaxID=104609 RepID=UPI000CEA10AE|nr:lamin tail domain-containing protein [Vibrio penaeicida]